MRTLTRLLILILAAGIAYAGNVSMPLFFLPNPGVADPQFQYLVQTPRFHAGFGVESVVFHLPGNQIRLGFPGASRSARIVGAAAMSGHVNFLKGNSPETWHTDLPTYGEIVYRDLYPGIDLAYRGSGAELKSEFRVAAGADPAIISLRYSEPVTIDNNGDLIVSDGDTELREKAPDVFQETEQGRVTVKARYVLRDANTVAFELGTFDRTMPLIIDPVISYATYLGGSAAGAITAPQWTVPEISTLPAGRLPRTFRRHLTIKWPKVEWMRWSPS